MALDKLRGRFMTFYREELLRHLAPHERKRKKIRTTLLVTGGIITAFAAMGVAAAFKSGDPRVGVFVVIIAIVLISIISWFSIRGYRKAFKNDIITRIVKFVDRELSYNPDGFIDRSAFATSSLFQHRIDRYRGEDLIYGKLGKTSFKASEIHAEYKTEHYGRNGRRTEWHTIFRGLFYVADFNKDFHSTTVVLPDIAERLLGSWFGKMLQKMNIARSGKLVQLEDPEFEKLFAVYGQDQVEARYILTPSLMQRLVQFRRKVKSGLFVSFTRSHVFIAIPSNRNMLEPPLFKSLTDFSVVREYIEFLALVAGVVDDLNLNTRIWTKR